MIKFHDVPEYNESYYFLISLVSSNSQSNIRERVSLKNNL